MLCMTQHDSSVKIRTSDSYRTHANYFRNIVLIIISYHKILQKFTQKEKI